MSKKIVITGATKGIGRAIAEKFAMNGWSVAACARKADDVEALLSFLQTNAPSPDSKFITQVCDVSNKEQLKSFAHNIQLQWGSVDVLVNNAGVFLPGQIINEADGQLEKLMETNLYSAYNLSRFLLPAMIGRAEGHIFNISSVAGLQAYNNGGSYSISKFAMMGLSKALREELKPHGIRVTALMPGATLTDSWGGTSLPADRFMKTEDVAELVWSIHHLSKNTDVEEVLLRPLLGDI
jgi:NADP-dependent 3-hydroxy acid dehydrogenase YdfG